MAGLYVTAFAANAVILIFEIAGARLLAPYLGTSVEVWSGTIAVILGGMAIGYFFGGIAADKRPEQNILALLLFLAGCAALVTWALRDLIPSQLSHAGGLPLTFAAMYMAALLFVPTTILLAAVSPFIAKFLITTLNASARVVGNINAIGTIGSIAGAVLSGAVLIPLFGLSDIFLGIAVLLILLSLLVGRANLGAKALVLLLIVGALGLAQQVRALDEGIIADIATPYNRVWVMEQPHDGRTLRTIHTDPFGTQCGMYVADDGTVDEEAIAFRYVRAFRTAAEAFLSKDGAHRALFLGGCNYSYPRAFLTHYGKAQATVVELDPGMTDIAVRFFALLPERYPALSIVHLDARRFVRTSGDTYDIAFVDVFGSASNIPHHLTTREWYEELSGALAPDGIMVMNVIGPLAGPASDFTSSLLKTAQSAFRHAELYTLSGLSHHGVQNLILLASNDGALPETLGNSGDITLSRTQAATLPEGMVFTDNYAPVEYLTYSVRERLF